MRLLLDTVALYRVATSPQALPRSVRTLLEDDANDLFVSIVSAWEMTIKSSLGKLPLPRPIEELFPQTARDMRAEVLGLEIKHIARVANLPPHHADPFDRAIVAQALIDGCAVVTSDARFAGYGVSVRW